jgi:hypothetical protein
MAGTALPVSELCDDRKRKEEIVKKRKVRIAD